MLSKTLQSSIENKKLFVLTRSELSRSPSSLLPSFLQPHSAPASAYNQDLTNYHCLVSLLAAAMHAESPTKLGLQFSPPRLPNVQARLVGGHAVSTGFDPEEKVPSTEPKLSEMKNKPLGGHAGLMFWTREQYIESQVM